MYITHYTLRKAIQSNKLTADQSSRSAADRQHAGLTY